MGPGIPPVAPKLVAAIVSGEFIDLVSLLEDHTQLEAQSFSLVADLFIIRPAKRQTITHILSWMQAFSVYMLVVTASYPARVSDLLKYQLLIMCTAQQLSGSAIEIIDRLPSTHSRSIISMGSAWVSYDRASRRQAAAYNLNDSMVTNKSRTISFLRTRPCFGRTTHSCPPPFDQSLWKSFLGTLKPLRRRILHRRRPLPLLLEAAEFIYVNIDRQILANLSIILYKEYNNCKLGYLLYYCSPWTLCLF